MRFLFLDSTDPHINLACEELLARHASEPCVMLWRNEPSIIVGCNQNTAAEIDDSFVQAHGIHVVRRITGGGAVYHDLGNINYSCISLEREWSQEAAAVFAAPIVNALHELGILADFSGRNDIIANGCKISGCARSVPKEHTLFHGTLLFDTDLDILAQALKPDPDKIKSKGIKSVRARVGNIRAMLPASFATMTMGDFIAHLRQSISRYYGGAPCELPHQELLEEAHALADSKYRTWEWNYGTAINYQVRKRLMFAGGIITSEFNVEKNRITALSFSGDFFGARPIAAFIPNLLGLPPRREALLNAINALPYQDYIAGISPDDLADLLAI